MNNLPNLPNEVLLKIFNYSDLPNKFKFKQLNKQWYKTKIKYKFAKIIMRCDDGEYSIKYYNTLYKCIKNYHNYTPNADDCCYIAICYEHNEMIYKISDYRLHYDCWCSFSESE